MMLFLIKHFQCLPKKARWFSLKALTNPEVSIHGEIETLQKPFICNSLCPVNRGASWSLSPTKASSITQTSNRYQKQMFDENFSCFLSFSPLNPHWEVKVRKRNTIDVKGKVRDEKSHVRIRKGKLLFTELFNTANWTQQSCKSLN